MLVVELGVLLVECHLFLLVFLGEFVVVSYEEAYGSVKHVCSGFREDLVESIESTGS